MKYLSENNIKTFKKQKSQKQMFGGGISSDTQKHFTYPPTSDNRRRDHG